MAGSSKPKGRKGKIGRYKGYHLQYANERRREKSHIRRMTKHMKRYPKDSATAELLKNARIRLGEYHQSLNTTENKS